MNLKLFQVWKKTVEEPETKLHISHLANLSSTVLSMNGSNPDREKLAIGIYRISNLVMRAYSNSKYEPQRKAREYSDALALLGELIELAPNERDYVAVKQDLFDFLISKDSLKIMTGAAGRLESRIRQNKEGKDTPFSLPRFKTIDGLSLPSAAMTLRAAAYAISRFSESPLEKPLGFKNADPNTLLSREIPLPLEK